MPKANFLTTSSLPSLEIKYINNISAITGLTVEQVKEVFDVYRLLILHEVACAEKPKNTITIPLPCFCSLIIAETTHPNSKNRLQVKLNKYFMGKQKRYLEEAFFDSKDMLTETVVKNFSQSLKDDLKRVCDNERK